MVKECLDLTSPHDGHEWFLLSVSSSPCLHSVLSLSPPAAVLRPTLTVLGPSEKELQQQGSATLACLAAGGSPSSWRLSWSVVGSGGDAVSQGVSLSSSEVPGTDGRYSWSSTLSLSAEQWRGAGSVVCQASLDGQRPVTQSLERDRCSA